MRLHPVAGWLFAGVALGGCAASTQIVDLGSGVHVMTKRNGTLVQRPAELKAQVEQEALAYCRDHGAGAALDVLDSRAIEGNPPAPASAVVEFRCVAP